MKYAFLICGPESSGTGLVAKIFQNNFGNNSTFGDYIEQDITRYTKKNIIYALFVFNIKRKIFLALNVRTRIKDNIKDVIKIFPEK